MSEPLYQFYDPHPGLAGCPEPLPQAAKLVADWIDGKRLTAKEAVRVLSETIRDSQFTVEFKRDCLMLSWTPVDGGYPQHCWRVSKARKVGAL